MTNLYVKSLLKLYLLYNVFRSGLRHIQHVWLNRDPAQKGDPTLPRPKNVRQQHDIFWPIRVSLWSAARFKFTWCNTTFYGFRIQRAVSQIA